MAGNASLGCVDACETLTIAWYGGRRRDRERYGNQDLSSLAYLDFPNRSSAAAMLLILFGGVCHWGSAELMLFQNFQRDLSCQLYAHSCNILSIEQIAHAAGAGFCFPLLLKSLIDQASASAKAHMSMQVCKSVMLTCNKSASSRFPTSLTATKVKQDTEHADLDCINNELL